MGGDCPPCNLDVYQDFSVSLKKAPTSTPTIDNLNTSNRYSTGAIFTKEKKSKLHRTSTMVSPVSTSSPPTQAFNTQHSFLSELRQSIPSNEQKPQHYPKLEQRSHSSSKVEQRSQPYPKIEQKLYEPNRPPKQKPKMPTEPKARQSFHQDAIDTNHLSDLKPKKSVDLQNAMKLPFDLKNHIELKQKKPKIPTEPKPTSSTEQRPKIPTKQRPSNHEEGNKVDAIPVNPGNITKKIIIKKVISPQKNPPSKIIIKKIHRTSQILGVPPKMPNHHHSN